jgi:hypothetical protein
VFQQPLALQVFFSGSFLLPASFKIQVDGGSPQRAL